MIFLAEYGHVPALVSIYRGWEIHWNPKLIIFTFILRIDTFNISCKNALRWMPQDLTDDQSTLVEIMTWCHQPTSHYLNGYWSSSVTPYGVTMLWWVDTVECECQSCCDFPKFLINMYVYISDQCKIIIWTFMLIYTIMEFAINFISMLLTDNYISHDPLSLGWQQWLITFTPE